MPNFFKKTLQPLGYGLSGIDFAKLSKTWVLQRQFNWQLFMPFYINGVFGPHVSSFCQDIRFADYSINQIESVQHGAFQRFYAGLQNITTVSLTFLSSVDNAALDYFYGWYHSMIDEDGFYYPKENYRKNIYVILYDRSGVESVRFTLKGAFPKNKPTVSLSYRSDDMLKFDISLSVDVVEMFSLIGTVRGVITNVLGNVASKTKEILGSKGGMSGESISKTGKTLFG